MYGVVTEVCVRQAAEGLLGLGKPVAIVSDAVWPFRQAVADDFLQAFRNNGGKVMTSGELLARSVRMSQAEAKQKTAQRAAELIESGMTVGIGSGTTSATIFIDHLAKRVRDGLSSPRHLFLVGQ